MMRAVSLQPVSVAVVGDSESFRLYKSGIMNFPNCGTRLTHAVTIVGYGETKERIQFWLVKNSWGSSWGEMGYFRILREANGSKGGMCGLLRKGSYPVLR